MRAVAATVDAVDVATLRRPGASGATTSRPGPPAASSTRCCADAGFADVLDTVELLVTEVVTNAVMHARSEASVVIRLLDDAVRVEVTDADDSFPARRVPRDDQPGGRGLDLVEKMSRSWGIDMLTVGKRTWFEVARERGAVSGVPRDDDLDVVDELVDRLRAERALFERVLVRLPDVTAGLDPARIRAAITELALELCEGDFALLVDVDGDELTGTWAGTKLLEAPAVWRAPLLAAAFRSGPVLRIDDVGRWARTDRAASQYGTLPRRRSWCAATWWRPSSTGAARCWRRCSSATAEPTPSPPSTSASPRRWPGSCPPPSTTPSASTSATGWPPRCRRRCCRPLLPSIPGVDLGARYRAAVSESQVGGDFYDVFRAGERWGAAHRRRVRHRAGGRRRDRRRPLHGSGPGGRRRRRRRPPSWRSTTRSSRPARSAGSSPRCTSCSTSSRAAASPSTWPGPATRRRSCCARTARSPCSRSRRARCSASSTTPRRRRPGAPRTPATPSCSTPTASSRPGPPTRSSSATPGCRRCCRRAPGRTADGIARRLDLAVADWAGGDVTDDVAILVIRAT